MTVADPSSSGIDPVLTIYYQELVNDPNPCKREMNFWTDPAGFATTVDAAAVTVLLTPPAYYEGTDTCDPLDFLWTIDVTPAMTVTSTSTPIAFDTSTFILTVYTTDSSHIGSYSVTVTTTAPTVGVQDQPSESAEPFTISIAASLIIPGTTIDTTTEADSEDYDIDIIDETQA